MIKIITYLFICFCLLITPVNAIENWEIINDSTETHILCLKEFKDSIYSGTYPNGLICKSSNGVDWQLVNDTSESHILCLESFDNYIYAGSRSNGLIYRSVNGIDWEIAYDTTESYIRCLKNFNGYIYAGTYPNGLIYASKNGVNWNLVIDTTEQNIFCLESFNNFIYAGTSPNGLIYRSNDGINWNLINDTSESHIFCLESFKGSIYAGTYPNGLIYKSINGINWDIVNNTTELYVPSLKEFNGYIYGGTYPNGLIYRSVNGIDWELANDTTESCVLCLESFDGSIYGGTSTNGLTYKMTPPAKKVSLVSSSPSILSPDYCGDVNFSYLVSHSAYGIDYTSMAFLSGVNYTPTNDYKMSIRVPSNNLADPWLGYGNILRNQQRNITPYLTWETNNTITEGNVYKWGGGDHNSTWITENSINNTHTFINISGPSPNVYPCMHYLCAWDMYQSKKTVHLINKWNGFLFKVWDNELVSGRSLDYCVKLCLDTVESSNMPDHDIQLWWANDSFDPSTDDPTNTIYGGYIDSANYTEWVNHTYIPTDKSSYAGVFTWCANLTAGDPQPTGYNYLYLWADVAPSKSYYINITDVDTQTNISFANTNVLWNRDHNINHPMPYTPSLFMMYPRNHEMLETHLYVQDNDSSWYHSPIHQTVIGQEYYPPNPGIIKYFETLGIKDYDMDGYYSNNITIGMECGNDPDGGSVIHKMELCDSSGIVSVINSSISCNGASYIRVLFNSTPFYSDTSVYYILLSTTDDELVTVTTQTPNFYIKSSPILDENVDVHVSIFIVMIIIGIVFMIITFVCNIKPETSLITSMISSITLILTGMLMFTTDVVLYETTHIYSTNNSFIAMFLIMLGIIMALYILVILVSIVMNHKNKKFDQFYDGQG